MTRLDTLASILARHPGGLTTPDLAARLGTRPRRGHVTPAEVHDLIWRLRARGVTIESVGGTRNVRYRLAS